MQREPRNFDDPFGISCELEKSRSHFRGSGATPAEVSEPSGTHRDTDRITPKSYLSA